MDMAGVLALMTEARDARERALQVELEGARREAALREEALREEALRREAALREEAL